MKLILPVMFFAFPVVLAAGADDQGIGTKWREVLGASDFAKREEAMEELWEIGDDALVVLEKLRTDRNPEVAARARMLFRKVKLGITPETPEKLVLLIENYWSGSSREKISILKQLKSQAEFDFLFRLAGMETDPMVRRSIDELVASELPKIVRGLLNEGKQERARELLGKSDQLESMINLGHLLQLSGELEKEIERLRASESKPDQKRYLAYLKVKGDAVLLRSEAARLGDQRTELLAALVLGDFTPYFESLLQKGRMSDPARDYLRWVLAEHSGDEAKQKEILNRVSKTAELSVGPILGAKVTLFRMGYGDRVIASLPPERFSTILDYHEMQENFLLVEKMLELPSGKEFDGWLEKRVGEANQQLALGGPRPTFDRLVAATGFLEGRGRFEEAVKCCEALFDLSRKHGGFEREDWMGTLFYPATRALLSGVAREIEKYEEVVSVIFQELPRGSDAYTWLFNLLGKEDPKLSTRDRVLLTYSFGNRSYPLVDAATFNRYFDRVFKRISNGENKVEDLNKLSRLTYNRNRGDELLRIQEGLAREGVPNHYFLGLLAYDRGDVAKAGEHFAKFDISLDEAEPVQLFELGRVMTEAGLPKGKEFLEKAELYSAGSPRNMAAFAVQCIHTGDWKEAREYYEKALLRSPSLPSVGSYSLANAFVEELATLTAYLKEWQKAQAYREVFALMQTYRDGIEYGHYYSRNRFQVLVARGALAMENGEKDKAVSAFEEAHRILPRDGYLANELFPAMRELGLHDHHDRLFEKSAQHAREMIKRYPLDDNGYNSFAWMASRANRCLDEAEEYLKKALELNPQSAAYLDTMGEIYFARRNREEAVKWSEKSIANATLGENMKWELHHQNARFRSGEFPAR